MDPNSMHAALTGKLFVALKKAEKADENEEVLPNDASAAADAVRHLIEAMINESQSK